MTIKISEDSYRLIMIAGLWVGIILFLFAIIALAKNIEEIKNDPIIYGMEKHEFVSCQCLNKDFQTTNINLNDYISKEG